MSSTAEKKKKESIFIYCNKEPVPWAYVGLFYEKEFFFSIFFTGEDLESLYGICFLIM